MPARSSKLSSRPSRKHYRAAAAELPRDPFNPGRCWTASDRLGTSGGWTETGKGTHPSESPKLSKNFLRRENRLREWSYAPRGDQAPGEGRVEGTPRQATPTRCVPVHLEDSLVRFRETLPSGIEQNQTSAPTGSVRPTGHSSFPRPVAQRRRLAELLVRRQRTSHCDAQFWRRGQLRAY